LVAQHRPYQNHFVIVKNTIKIQIACNRWHHPDKMEEKGISPGDWNQLSRQFHQTKYDTENQRELPVGKFA
jgi:predicted sulfurtransferase